jgi:uncharacterized protein (DUF302 family)
MTETIKRLKKDVADKGIMFFDEIDQSELAADAGVNLRPSTLLVFGNPPLGTLFLTSNPAAGLDWPVRLLVYQDDKSDVWVLYTDFTWIAHRHGITDRDEAFKKHRTLSRPLRPPLSSAVARHDAVRIASEKASRECLLCKFLPFA